MMGIQETLEKKFSLADMTHGEIDALLKKQMVCRISFNDRPSPYTIPMEYYYFGDVMYFHVTSSGKKMALWSADQNVTVEVDWWNNDLSDYKSVIATGRLAAVESHDEKNILNVAMAEAVRGRSGIKGLLKMPWGKKGINFLTSSNIPMTLMKLDVKEIRGKKAR
jgi:uncharacterized protein